MTTISHEPVEEEQRGQARLRVPEMWASLAIVAMWMAVVVALFAFLGTWVVARRGFGRERDG